MIKTLKIELVELTRSQESDKPFRTCQMYMGRARRAVSAGDVGLSDSPDENLM
jgi:hypothetical protein